VVRRAIAALGGQVGIRSGPGAGTTVTARLPLTLAIVEGLVVAVGDERYVVPLDFVVESLAADAVVRRNVGGCAGTIEVRGDYLPLVDLAEVLDAPPASEHAPGAVIVIAQAGGVRAGLRVDAVAGQQQVVIKRLDANFRAVSGFSAATVLGDGRVALILDVAALVGRVHRPRAGAGLGAACAAPLQKAARRP
jgi:two-component system chemotaxis sensor kinase CheA